MISLKVGNKITSQISNAVKGIIPSPAQALMYRIFNFESVLVSHFVSSFTLWFSCPCRCRYDIFWSCCSWCSCCGCCGLFADRHITLLPSYPLGGGVAPDTHVIFSGGVPAVVVVSGVRVGVPLGGRLVPILAGSTRLCLAQSSSVGDTWHNTILYFFVSGRGNISYDQYFIWFGD